MLGFGKRTERKERHSAIIACLIICVLSGVLAGCSVKTRNNTSTPEVLSAEDDTQKDAENENGNDSTEACDNKDEGNETAADDGNKAEGGETDKEINVTPTPTEAPEYPYDGPCPYQITTLPVVVINTGSSSVSATDDYTDCLISFYTYDGSYDAEKLSAGIRLRGNVTRNMEKKSYRFKLEEKANLFGLANGKEKVWTLLANHCDQSLLRNYAAFMLQRGFDGVSWSPNGMSVELYVNGKYRGVYLLAEQIKVSKDRVNINDKDPDAIDTGYLVHFSAYAEENVFRIGDSKYEVKSELSEDPELRSEQINFIEDYITRCREALETGDEEEAEKLIDIDSLVAAYLTEEIAKNIDSQWDSFYMHKDKGGKLVIGPLWDFDLAFGNDHRAASTQLDSYKHLYVAHGRGSVNGTGDTIFELAMNNDWFRQRVKDTWNTEYERIAGLADLVEAEAGAGRDAYDRNFTKWRIFGRRINMEPAEIMRLKSFEEHAAYLVTWIRNRVEWLNTEFNKEDFVHPSEL